MSPEAEFATRLGVLAEVFGEQLSALRVAGYWAALSDLHAEDVWAALDTALRESRFFPRPAELREFAGHASHRRLTRARELDDQRRRRLELPMSIEDRTAHEARVARFLADIKTTVRALPSMERRPHGRGRA